MIRVMFDTDNLGDLDGHFELLATYADLVTSHAQLHSLRMRFPDSELLFYDRNLGDPLDIATIADVEPRAMTVDQLPSWKARKEAAGHRYLTGYCDREDLAAVEEIIHNGLYHGVATLDGTCFIEGWQPLHGPAFVQILGESKLGVHGDMSIVLEDGWHPRTAWALNVPPYPYSGTASPIASGHDVAPSGNISEPKRGDRGEPFPPDSRPRPA